MNSMTTFMSTLFVVIYSVITTITAAIKEKRETTLCITIYITTVERHLQQNKNKFKQRQRASVMLPAGRMVFEHNECTMTSDYRLVLHYSN